MTGRRALLGCLLMALAACQPLAQPVDALSAAPVGTLPPLVRLPGTGPSALAVTTRGLGGSRLVQHVVLANATTLSGENALDLQVEFHSQDLGDLLAGANRPSVIVHFTRAALDERLAREFPGLPVTLADLVPTGRLGPYGYATATATATGPGGAVCLFAWLNATGRDLGLAEAISQLSLQARRCDRQGSVAALNAWFSALDIDPIALARLLPGANH